MGNLRGKLIAGLAAGALVAVMVPGAAFAALPNGSVSVTVDAATSITVPAAFSIGAGIPTTQLTSESQTVSWNSIDSGNLGVTLSDLSDGASHTILANTVGISIDSGSTYHVLDTVTAFTVGTLGLDGSQNFTLQVTIPWVPAATYTGTLTFAPEP